MPSPFFTSAVVASAVAPWLAPPELDRACVAVVARPEPSSLAVAVASVSSTMCSVGTNLFTHMVFDNPPSFAATPYSSKGHSVKQCSDGNVFATFERETVTWTPSFR